MLARFARFVAPAAGWVARWAVRYGPAAGGAVCIVTAAALLYVPLGLAAAGAFLLLLDRRIDL